MQALDDVLPEQPNLSCLGLYDVVLDKRHLSMDEMICAQLRGRLQGVCLSLSDGLWQS